jgi:glycosyltransferase involved in cell wall biosynthesis
MTAAMPRPDLLLVSLGGTAGLREADAELADSIRRAGADVVMAFVRPPREVRTFALTDLAWARAARRATVEAPLTRTVLYSSVTAALLAPRSGAIRFDAPAAGNRPGRHGVWQRPVERHRLERASLLVPWSAGGLTEAGVTHDRFVIVPVPIEPSSSGGPDAVRDLAAITYGANPHKKGLDRVLAAWRVARRDDEELLVAGLTAAEEPGVRYVGAIPRETYRALLRRARVFVSAPRREDYGIAQLEALADGCSLVTTPSSGPYAALPLAMALDTRLICDSGELAHAIRVALDAPREGYAARASELLGPWRREAVDRVVASELLPRLFAG